MLDAVIHKKLRGEIKDLIHKGSELHRLRQEDVITSTVFGPLKYMSATDAWLAILSVLLPERAVDLRDFVPTNSAIRFWPKLTWRGSKIEPDLICEFMDNRWRHVVVIEVKWNAELSEAQLPSQAHAVLLEYGHGATTRHHILIAKTVASKAAREQIGATTQCKGVSWYQIAAESRGPLTGSGGLWRREIKKFLALLGIRAFDRFDLDLAQIDSHALQAIGNWRTDRWDFNHALLGQNIDLPSTRAIQQWRLSM